MNMNIIVFKFNWVTLYWWEKKREEKTNNKERQKYKAKQTLRQKKKERVADELTDQMAVLSNQESFWSENVYVYYFNVYEFLKE